MYDTTNFWIDSSMVGGNPFAMLNYLGDITERQNEKWGYSASGKTGDYTANIYNTGISLKGSLAKYYLPSNVYTLSRSAAKESMEKLSDELHVDIREAKVTRIDVSTVIPTSRPPAEYYPFLGLKPYFTRLQATLYTLYYNTIKRQIVFYDKIKEATAKTSKIPDTLKNSNLMRYELRFLRELPRQLQTTSTITGKTLINPQFYYKIIQYWKEEFYTINKINNNIIMKDTIKTPKDAKNAFLAILISQNGVDAIDCFINDLKAQNVYSDPKYYSRVKTDLNRIMTAHNMEKNELINELEKAIDNVAKYAR